MPSALPALIAFAVNRAGYFTTAEAKDLGVSDRMLSHHASAGMLERLSYGIYRLTLCPHHELEDLIVAALWGGPESSISHTSALLIHGLGGGGAGDDDVAHLTAPQGFRGKRAGVVVHRQELPASDVVEVDSIRVTSPERTLLDVALVDPPTARAAALLALEQGITTLERLEHRLRTTEDVEARRALLGDAFDEKDETMGAPASAHADNSVAPEHFVGRVLELADLEEVMASSRLVTLTGPPGVGKSALARQLAARVAAQHPDGTFIVELATTLDPNLLPATVAGALSVWEEPGRPIIENIVDYQGSQQVLIVLDNCEHLLGACAALAKRVVRACPNVSIVATSQAPLEAPKEKVWPVPPLGVPGPEASAEALAECDAVQLFVRRATTTHPGFRLDEESLPVVADICRRLDGLPLAIELAAARVGVLTPADIAARLDERLTLLGEGKGEGEGDGSIESRHHSIRTTLEWSYYRLPVAEQVLLQRLSVFVGRFSADAVEAVCGDEHQPDSRSVLDSLASLVAKSLVVADTSGTHARYRLLETIRIFAAERLAAEDGHDIRARHARWFLAMAEGAEAHFTGPQQLATLANLDADHDNLRAALTHFIERGSGTEAIRLAGALGLFWRARGHFSEGRRWLVAARTMSDGNEAVTAKASFGEALLSVMVGELAACEEAGQLSLRLSREAKDLGAQARALLVLGNARLWSEHEVARQMFDEAVDLARRANDTWCLAHALGMLGRAFLDAGDTTGARRCLEECVAIGRSSDDHQSLRLGLLVHGDLALHRGDLEHAERLFTEGLAIARQHRDAYAGASAIHSLGQVTEARGQRDRAWAYYAEAQVVGRQAGTPYNVAAALCSQGFMALGYGADARPFFDEALSVAKRAGMNLDAPLVGLGWVAAAEGDPAAARALFEEALVHAEARSAHGNRAHAISSLGHLDRRGGDAGRALSRHLEALGIHHKLGSAPEVAPSLEAVAADACDLGRFEYAARLLGAAEAIRESRGYAHSPPAQQTYDFAMAAVVKALGKKASKAALAEGRTMSMARAVAYARRGRGARKRSESGLAGLTDAEREVAALVAEGLTNDQIGVRLFISGRTVGSHLSNIFSKLGVASRAEVASLQSSKLGEEKA